MTGSALAASIKHLTSPRGYEIFTVFLPSSSWRAGGGAATSQLTPSRPLHTRWAQSAQAGGGCAHKNIKEGQQSPCQSRAMGHIRSQQGGWMSDPLELQSWVKTEVTAFILGIKHHPGPALEGRLLHFQPPLSSLHTAYGEASVAVPDTLAQSYFSNQGGSLQSPCDL